MNRRELLLSRLRGLEAEYAMHETILHLTLSEGGTADLTKQKINYIVRQYEKWEAMLNKELDNDD